MALPSVPAYLQQSARQAINEQARQAVSSGLPPHISIKGNVFTFVDAAGNTYNGGPVIQAAIIDVSDTVCKLYYGSEYEEGSDDPPLCWSTNGIAPSQEAIEPQARTCAECEWNKRGSATSKKSGAAIKACRDETHVALILPQYPTMMFRLVITPGSFKNWGGYLDSIKGVALQNLITQIDFVPRENGVLNFSAIGYIPQEVYQVRELAYQEKKTDGFVGRNDRPRMLAAPAAAPQIAQQPQQAAAPLAVQPATAAPAPMPFATSQSPTDTSMTPTTAGLAGGVTNASPSEPPKRRGPGRRPAAQQPAQAAPQPQAQPQGFNPAPAPAQAPFRPQPAPAAAPQASQGPAFGVTNAPPPNGDLAAMVNQLFPQNAQR